LTSEAGAGPDLHDRRYLALLGGAALLGIPLSLVAFLFLAAVHELEHLLWHSLPHELGYAEPPAWWAIAALGLGGVLVGLAVRLVPALAIGMAAGVAVIGLPITSVLLVVLLLGDAAASQMPVVILAAVVALVVGELLTTYGPRRQAPGAAMGVAAVP
jgi:hypothetical protein